MTIPNYLLSDDGCEKREYICYGDCSTPVKDDPDNGRWYITMGHPGFNSDANNADGYKSRNAAHAAMKKYSNR